MSTAESASAIEKALLPIPKVGMGARLRECMFDDHNKIAELTARHGIQTEPRDEWLHLWIANPAYKKVGPSWPIGWVLEDHSGKVVGYLGNIPTQFVFRGRELLAATSRTWVVDEAYRGYALLLLDRHFSQYRVDLFVHPTVSAEASAAYATFGAPRVPTGNWARAVFWITGYVGMVQAFLRMRQVPFARVLSYPCGAALYLKERSTVKSLPLATGIALEERKDFDEAFDRFWNTLQARNVNVLLAVRNREALQWHFHYSLAQKRACVVVASRSGRVVAYAIFFRNDNRALSLKRLRLVDFQAIADSQDALLASLAWALAKCRQEGIHILEVIGFKPAGSDLIQALAPHSRPLQNWLYYYKVSNDALTQELTDSAVWNPCAFDGDASL